MKPYEISPSSTSVKIKGLLFFSFPFFKAVPSLEMKVRDYDQEEIIKTKQNIFMQFFLIYESFKIKNLWWLGNSIAKG